MSGRDELAYVDATLPKAEVLADEFGDFDCEASLKRIAQLAVSRATDKMDRCARMVKAQSGPRTQPESCVGEWEQPVYRHAAADLEGLSSQVVRHPDTVDAMARLVDDRSRIDPAGALAFACLLYLSDRHEGAQFWWQFAAGAGVAAAAYCLHLHHAQYSEDSIAEFWYSQAFMLHRCADDDLLIGPPIPLADEREERRKRAVEMFSWALDHAKIAGAVCRLEAATDEDYGLVPRPDPALAAELEEHFA